MTRDDLFEMTIVKRFLTAQHLFLVMSQRVWKISHALRRCLSFRRPVAIWSESLDITHLSFGTPCPTVTIWRDLMPWICQDALQILLVGDRAVTKLHRSWN